MSCCVHIQPQCTTVIYNNRYYHYYYSADHTFKDISTCCCTSPHLIPLTTRLGSCDTRRASRGTAVDNVMESGDDNADEVVDGKH